MNTNAVLLVKGDAQPRIAADGLRSLFFERPQWFAPPLNAVRWALKCRSVACLTIALRSAMQDSVDHVVKLNLGYVPDASVSQAIVLQTEVRTVLTFAAEKVTRRTRRPAGYAIVEFVRCQCTQFGYPNDEALVGHPLYSITLDDYALFEVQQSSWKQRLEQQNRVAFPHTNTWELRHFLITFHDSTFECLAQDLQFTLMNKPYAAVFRYATERLFGRGA